MGKTLAVDVPKKYIVECLPPPPPKDYKFTCSSCDKQFVKLSRLKMHQVTHLPVKPLKCSFEGCESSYFRNNHLKRHEATSHSTLGGDFKCTFDGCVASFEKSKSLYFHNKKRHSDTVKFSCSQCPEIFNKKFQLKEHEIGHPGMETALFKCGFKGCNEEFRYHNLLKSHKKIHRRIAGGKGQQRKKYPCTETDCTDVFDNWSSYTIHRKAAHRVMKECPTCHKKISHAHYRKHLKIHEENTSLISCSYEGCTKTYHHSQNLAHHIKTVHEGRSFVCGICDKKLSTKQKLNHHVKVIHSNTPPPPKVEKEKFSRQKFIDMLSYEMNFEITRPGPPMGSTIANDDSSVIELPQDNSLVIS